MNDRQDTQDHSADTAGTGLLQRSARIIDRVRNRCGASRRQFAIFSLLTLVAATMWARPAGLLIWNRLRIITGMPRMAIADQDPEVVAQADMILPDSVEAGRSVFLEERLRRDPFTIRARNESDPIRPGTNPSEDPEVADPDALKTRLLAGVTAMRLNGSGEGLTTAIIDNRARVVGRTFEAQGLRFRLLEVHSNSVVIEASADGRGEWHPFLLERSGATPVLRD